jgi:hypothetical protein
MRFRTNVERVGFDAFGDHDERAVLDELSSSAARLSPR